MSLNKKQQESYLLLFLGGRMKRNTSGKNRPVCSISILQTIPCAVLVPLVWKDGEECILLEVRSKQLTWQPHDICFPGGKIESLDTSLEAAAVRETSEELGISLEHIHIDRPLDYVESPIGVTVYPFVAHVDTLVWQPNKEEVEEILVVPISVLMQNTPQVATFYLQGKPDQQAQEILQLPDEWQPRTSYYVKIFTYKEYKIWGITAYILDNFMVSRAIIT